MKRFNKYGADDKNVITFDTEILDEYKGESIADDLIIMRAFTKKDECYILFAPNFADKKIGLSLDRTTPFSDAVLTYLINSGEAQKIMSAIYNSLGWNNNVEATSPKYSQFGGIELPSLPQLPQLDKLN
jgi:hypothetical protein